MQRSSSSIREHHPRGGPLCDSVRAQIDRSIVNFSAGFMTASIATTAPASGSIDRPALGTDATIDHRPRQVIRTLVHCAN